MDKISFSRNLRHNQTETEKILWYRLRNRQLTGHKFKRQYPLGKYIVDFVCFEKKLIIELDGGQHAEETNIQNDQARTNWLESQGFKVIRFWDNEVRSGIDSVLEKIYLTLTLS